ncbi:MAG: hypothetical protein NZO16_01575 [Deltaproteobacteria bacterium]|nr:hypothetical protein [Deltaproteobacteria bacterium]
MRDRRRLFTEVFGEVRKVIVTSRVYKLMPGDLFRGFRDLRKIAAVYAHNERLKHLF